jgi:hypothetical protein
MGEPCKIVHHCIADGRELREASRVGEAPHRDARREVVRESKLARQAILTHNQQVERRANHFQKRLASCERTNARS